MKLSFKFKPSFTVEQLSIIEELSYHTTKLYNIINYDLREKGFKTYVDIENSYKSNWHCDFLHSHTRQHCFKILEQNWKSYFASIKDYKENPHKYKGLPKPPKFKNMENKKNEIVFTNLAIRFKENTLMLSLSKAIQKTFEVESLNFEVSNKLQSLINWNELQQVRIKWDNSLKQWYLIVIYNKQELEPINNTNIMAIDLGLDNLATLTFKEGNETYLFCGKKLKCINAFVNKKNAYYQSIEMNKCGSNKFKNTKMINSLRRYRNNYVNDYLHKVSKNIIDKAIEHKVKKIVIGKIKGIKQDMNYNKSFVQIPVQRLAELIKYKAKLKGIEIKFKEESYTSGCSAFDLEPINKKHYDKTRRVVRGLFKSSFGLVNSDVNGSLNILRKEEKCIPEIVQTMRDKGSVSSPLRVRVAC
ncbi:IS200/IS605 family element transposase accessory protein TnpB [Anaerosalibacter bizertensis]|uniref:Transposase n=1 Tax=Anaerosalibacter bizertensis TaxID=932217 RepID=A0A844FGG7_9FIRM|nr:RNA-guided endonuclease TnpB family protein [Anaerosalibacter bizertensis]MBV1819145.1 transposase [Bacteroidales bacterium MSK.15.36]MCB5560165.1 transposase [Anaerosalibacter bizertensis]MCG4563822.1 transposase [Anaerosalibacter bizertensis]MCG4583430.1 transposase [Anaerosalibacter bizertensis]MSS43127.1 IS200/IS605 family element transposase accessory protein TnpB [Anaerosalibacter bizertensis]